MVLPTTVLAQSGPFIPCQGSECGFYHLMALVNNIIRWLILVSFPVAAGVLAWAGFKFMTTGIVDERTAAKKMIQKVFIGYVFILSAWIIVGTITNALLKDPRIVPVETKS